MLTWHSPVLSADVQGGHMMHEYLESVLSRNLERDTRNGQNGFLLEDAGYPLNNVTTPEQRRFNFPLSQTRGTIKRAFGIRKWRYQYL